MAGLQLQPLPSAGSKIVDDRGGMDPVFRIALQAILEQIAGSVNSLAEAVAAIEAAQAAADAAQAAADAADAAATAAQASATQATADAAAAQTAADNAQAAVDAIEVPPTGSRTVTTSEVLTSADHAILADASGGAITLTLPSAATAENSIVIVKKDASVNAVNVAPGGSDEINDSGSALAITVQYEQRTFNSDGTADWYG